MGNVGPCGYVHAKMARLATKVIDEVAYGGRNIRREFAELLRSRDVPSNLIEVGCGVGTLTHELARVDHFERIRAFDTSNVMIAQARTFAKSNDEMGNVEFEVQNACDVGSLTADIAVSSFMMHELPVEAHEDVLHALLECTKQRRGEAWIMDIDTTYSPSAAMLSGEPYVEAYLSSIDHTMSRVAEENGVGMSVVLLLRNHVRLWRFKHLDETA